MQATTAMFHKKHFAKKRANSNDKDDRATLLRAATHDRDGAFQRAAHRILRKAVAPIHRAACMTQHMIVRCRACDEVRSKGASCATPAYRQHGKLGSSAHCGRAPFHILSNCPSNSFRLTRQPLSLDALIEQFAVSSPRRQDLRVETAVLFTCDLADLEFKPALRVGRKPEILFGSIEGVHRRLSD